MTPWSTFLVVSIIGAAAAAAVFAVLGLASFRRLVDYQFKHHHSDWVRSGKPLGGSDTRANASFLGSDFATVMAMLVWLDERPAWLEPTCPAESWRRQARRYLILALLFAAAATIASITAITKA